MYTERIYSYPYARALGRCPVDEFKPAHAERSHEHTRHILHKSTSRNPYPYLSAPKNTPAPLAVVSRQARLCYRWVSYPLVTCASATLRTLVRCRGWLAGLCERLFVLLGVPNFFIRAVAFRTFFVLQFGYTLLARIYWAWGRPLLS